ncbi:MAG: 4Fe-4S binding protein [Anaerolineae bacterium]|nr:4Fe-4S binding protein [Anaerolineae bacterium]
MARGTILIDEERCKGCGLCPTVCPQEIIHLEPKKLNAKGYHPAVLVDPDSSCTGCAICAVICPDTCITVYREARATVR